MGKIKKLLMSALACVGVLGCAAVVGSKVELKKVSAMSVDSSGKIADWSASEMDGLLLGSTYDFSTCSFAQTTTLNIKEHILLIPVPNGSEGTLSVTSSANKTDRFVTLMNSDGSLSSTKIDMKKSAQKLSFNSSNIILLNEKYYIGINPKTDDYKISTLKINLTTGVYSLQHSVKYYDGSSVLKNVNVTGGEKSTYDAKKWGYDLEGYYSDSDLTLPYDNDSTVNEDINVYTKWNAWDETVYGDGTRLNQTLMNKGLDTFGTVAFGSDVKLTNTNYTVLNGATSFMSVSEDVEGLGKATAALKTGGGMSASNLKNGLKYKASEAGTLYAYVRSASSTDYALEAYGPKNLSSELKASTSSVSLLSIDIDEAGEYCIGAAGSVLIYSIYFEEAAPVPETVKLNSQFDNDTEKNAVRFIGTINAKDLAKVSDIKLDLTLSNGENSKTVTVSFDTVYTSITDLKGFGEAEGVYYIVLELTDLSDFRACTLNATLKVTIDGVEETATKTISL